MCTERSAVTLRNHEKGRTFRLFRSFLQGWAFDLEKSWLGIVLTKDLSEWFNSPKPFLQKGSQSSEVENRGKDKIEEKAFQSWQCYHLGFRFHIKSISFLGCRII